MIVVVDTNIIFSGLLNPDGKIGDLLLNSAGSFDFFAPTFILDELENHHHKLIRISNFSEDELTFLKEYYSKRLS